MTSKWNRIGFSRLFHQKRFVSSDGSFLISSKPLPPFTDFENYTVKKVQIGCHKEVI